MTYSLAGRCARTGMLGSIVTTSSIAVGNRCQFARAGVGAVLTQHRTDPRLGPLGLSFLELGLSAPEAINALVSSTPHHGWRQLAVIDANGQSAHYSGHNIHSIHAGALGSNCVAIANVVRSAQVPAAMVHAFEAEPHQPLAERLCAALRAGRDAGGEFKQVTSAGLLVVHEHAFPYVDLRVDDHPDPIAEITRLWTLYAPVADNYLKRVLEPDSPQANALSVGYLTAEEARAVLAKEQAER
ncbi:MAG TPA: DUF1028 domain-containing protein [Hyphomicrobiaceae bacterium]|jgi:uncharacterized Ntn-hydrolase superfamily protein